MQIRTKISEIPPALRELFKEKSSYEQLIRQARWGEGVITLIASQRFISAGMGAAYAFESLLGWPVMVRVAAEYKAYSASVTHPRSVALVISPCGEEQHVLEAAQSAARRGATVLAITENTESSLAGIAHGVFRLTGGLEEAPFLRTLLVLQAELAWIALLAAKILNPRAPRLLEIGEEFEKLPDHLEWLRMNCSDAVRSLADRFREAAQITILGAGFYHPVAVQAATLAREVMGRDTNARNPLEFDPAVAKSLARDKHLALFLSGSQSKVKKAVHELAARMKQDRRSVFAITDTNDGGLFDCCEVSLLLPPLLEVSSALLTQAVVHWLLLESAHGER